MANTKKATKANNAEIIKEDMVKIQPAKFGETVPQMMAEIDIAFIGDFCMSDKDKAEWFKNHCKNEDGKTKKFPAFRREFCEAFYPDLLPKPKAVKKNTAYYLEQIEEKFGK